MVPVRAKRSTLETSRQELSEDVSFGIGTLLVVEQSSLENRQGGGDTHRRILYRCPVLYLELVWDDFCSTIMITSELIYTNLRCRTLFGEVLWYPRSPVAAL